MLPLLRHDVTVYVADFLSNGAHYGPIPNRPPTPYPYTLPLRSRGGSATLSAVPKPTSVERCGGGVGYRALKQRVCIGADLRPVST